MGDMEMIDKHGVKAIFTDDGVKIELVPDSERCDICNDPRIINEEGVYKCVACGCINRIDYNHHE